MYIDIYYLQLLSEIQELHSWEEKLDRLIAFVPTKNVPKEFALSQSNLKALCTAMYQRILAVQSYSLVNVKRINAPITLLKASAQSVRSISEDFELRKVKLRKFKYQE